MSSKLKLFVDIGDIYTKFMLLQDGKLVKKGSFLSVITPYPPVGDFYEYEEKIYFQGGKYYLAGWPTALTENFSILGSFPEAEICRVILNKILSDEITKKKVHVYLGVDFGEKTMAIKEMADSIGDRMLKVRSKHMYEEEDEVKSIRLDTVLVPAPLCLLEYVFSRVPDKLDENGKYFIVDIGYFRNKMYVVSRSRGVEDFTVDGGGMEMFYYDIRRYFRREGIQFNRFIMMKELELNYPYVTLESGRYSVESVVENIRWDFCKDIVQSIMNFVKKYVESQGSGPDCLILTGGGSILNREVIEGMLSSKKYNFGNFIFDRSPRYSVLEGMKKLEAAS